MRCAPSERPALGLRALLPTVRSPSSRASSEVLAARASRDAALDLAKDMEQHDDAEVQKRDDEHGLGGDLQALCLLVEERELVAPGDGACASLGGRAVSLGGLL